MSEFMETEMEKGMTPQVEMQNTGNRGDAGGWRRIKSL